MAGTGKTHVPPFGSRDWCNRVHLPILSGSSALEFRCDKPTVLIDQSTKFFARQIPVFPTGIPRVQLLRAAGKPSSSIDHLHEEFAPREHHWILTRKEVVAGFRAFLQLDGNALNKDRFGTDVGDPDREHGWHVRLGAVELVDPLYPQASF